MGVSSLPGPRVEGLAPLSEPRQQHETQGRQSHVLSDSPEDSESVFEDQDGAQAALQPAMSSAASHLTSSRTPAAEKATAMDRRADGAFFDGVLNEDETEGEGASSPEPASPHGSSPNLRPELPAGQYVHFGHVFFGSQQQPLEHPLPSPWTSAPKHVGVDKDTRSSQTRSVFSSAFGPTRQRRSRSAGQDALKRLTKALPSINMPTHLFPSLPASLRPNFTSDHKQGQGSVSRSATVPVPNAARLQQPRPLPGRDAQPPLLHMTSSPLQPRPSMLRRVTSDESILYSSLSRASSLGDDDRFHDVREMVNIRFMALKDSLPDVPNFKMPSLGKLQAASRMSSMSLNGFFASSAEDTSTWRNVDRSAGVPAESASKGSAANALDRLLEELTGDIVILGGYRGSVLRSAEAPHQQLWAPVKLGFNLRKANLEVGLEDEDEASMEERIIPSGMLKHIGPVDISRKLFKRLRSCDNARQGKLRVWDYGYDWRLSPALSSRKLREFLARLPSNQPGVAQGSRGAVVIAHSLGGLITRHAVNQDPALFAGVLYAGVPQRCINILGPFRNGDAVLFNEKLLTAQVNFSIRTSFVLLPDDGFCFIDKDTGDEYPVDFFDADEWAKWRLSPCVAPVLPPWNRDKQQAASPLSALFPNSLLKGNRSEKKGDGLDAGSPHEKKPGHGTANGLPGKDRTIAPRMSSGAAAHAHAAHTSPSSPPASPPPAPDRERYMAYLRRTLAATKKFRRELAHSPAHESANAYPPHAILYGKSIPTVYAAQVNGRAAIGCSDAYDDLVFRPGDGVALAREAMLPPGYALVRAGRVRTERGHLTMLGDLPAVARALEALLRGRKKGIGLGTGDEGNGSAAAATDDMTPSG